MARNRVEESGKKDWQVYSEQIQRSRCEAKTDENGTRCRRLADISLRVTHPDKRGRIKLIFKGSLCIECAFALRQAGTFDAERALE